MSKIKWIVRLEITVDESHEEGISRLLENGKEEFCKWGKVWLLPKTIRFYKNKYPEMRYKIIFFPRLHSFFTFFMKQNDYLYPHKGCEPEYAEGYPFKKAHLWKTRFGFKTAWELSK